MKITLSVISDFMLVATLPLMGILGFWEHNLSISETNHELVQIILVFLVFGWIFLWYSLGEQDRQYQIRAQENKKTTYYFQSISMSESDNHADSYKMNDVPALFNKLPNERVESLHVKNN